MHVGQVPRLYDIYKHQGIIENFEQLLENIFMPLFEVTLNPESKPQLHQFLSKVLLFLPCIPRSSEEHGCSSAFVPNCVVGSCTGTNLLPGADRHSIA